jgi:23S rRNA pseudouridine1911/1915/1917 synthase
VVNDGFEYREQVGPAAAGRTVLEHLTLRYRHSSEATWRERIDAGQVSLAGATATPEAVLSAGQWLAWRRPPWQEPDVPLVFAVLYRDAHLLAVAKPRGLPSVPGGGFLEHTLLHRVRRLDRDAAPVHRLGRGTSGLVVFARTAQARAALARAWREQRVERDYRALVAGIPPRELTIDAAIGPVSHPRLGRVHAASPDGKPSLSHVRVVALREGNALVDVRIATGRPHQVRIHLAAAGHPLVGDPLYGPGGRPLADAGLPGEPGYRLHAGRLRFDHPATGSALELECLPPPDLRC